MTDHVAEQSVPTLHVTSWASRRMLGPGRRWTIMARPRTWEDGDGVVRAFVPTVANLDGLRTGRLVFDEYRQRCLTAFASRPVGPGALEAHAGCSCVLVADGDTLCCSCSRALVARGECHRVWAAELLRRGGWRVVLDGRELEGVDEQWRPISHPGLEP